MLHLALGEAGAKIISKHVTAAGKMEMDKGGEVFHAFASSFHSLFIYPLHTHTHTHTHTYICMYISVYI